MAELEIALLGSPQVRRDGEPVRFDTRKAVALLAVLAVTGRRHGRDEIAALLWPDSDQAHARAALRRTLSAAGAIGPALVADRGGVALDAALITCDVSTFEAARRQGDVGAAMQAIDSYGGDFLAGFSLRDSPEFEDWRTGVADRLRLDLDQMLALLVEHHTTHGDLAEAVRCAQRRLSLDPLREEAHQQLIQLYAWSGQRTAALRQYRTCVRILDRELGVSPLPETTSVYDAVRANRLEPPAAPTTRAAEQPPLAPVVADSSPFVGRERELARLRADLDRAAQRPSTVAVVGEPGYGGSTLVDRFAEHARGCGALVVVVRGHEGEQTLAFAAATDLLRAVASSRPAAVASIAPTQRAALTRLLPSLSEQGVTDASDAPGARSQLFAAAHDVLGRLPEPGGVAVVVLEDVHWFDEDSGDLAAFLVRRLPPGLLLVLTWHGSSTPTAVAGAVSEAMRDGSADVLRLAALDRDEVAGLLESLGADAGPAAVDEVLVRTGGLPLLVTEAALATAGSGEAEGGGSRVEGFVRARLDAAGPTTTQVLAAVAAVAAPADPDLLRAVSGRTEPEVVAAVEEAVTRGLLVEIPERAAYDFPHDTLRHAVRSRTSLARSRLLHGRAAEALMQRHARRVGAVSAAVVARQLELAGREDEAVAWHAIAADEARRKYAHATAAEHLEVVLALGHDPGPTHLALGDAWLRLGRYDDAIASYEQAAALIDDRLALAEVEHRLAEVHHRLGEWDAALAHLESARDLLEAVPNQDDPGDRTLAARRSKVLADLALVCLRRGDLDDAGELAERAAGLADRAGEPAALAQSFNVLGVLAARRGEPVAARGHLVASLDQARRLDDPAPAVAALNNLARVEADAGDVAAALSAAEQALDLGTRYGDRHHTAALHANLADLLHRAGRDDEAREHLRTSAMLFADVDSDEVRRPEVWTLVFW